jgi:hypothetical protein
MSNRDADFAARIHERYPEGLTGVFAIGGTRTTYILEQNRDKADPGHIDDFMEQGAYLLRRYHDFIRQFISLGGQNLIITALSFRGFYNRGPEYAALVSQGMLEFINAESVAFYREAGIDPYFAGIEPLLLMPEDSATYHLGQKLAQFQHEWDYQEGRPKLVWEIASIPLLTFWQTYQQMDDVHRGLLQVAIDEEDNLEAVYRLLYQHFSRAAYGTEIPMPHFYLGTNKSGDLKWRSPLPLALSGGDYIRMFYTPYPTLFMTREAMQGMLEDLAFKDRFYSNKTDYTGKYTPELVQAEYERVMQLSATPDSILGLSRRVTAPIVEGD